MYISHVTEQQRYVLAELGEYLDTDPHNAESVRKTLDYLQNLNQLFEEGFLSHEKIDSFTHPVLLKMQEGMDYLTTWLDSLLEQGMYVLGVSFESLGTVLVIDFFSLQVCLPLTPARNLFWHARRGTSCDLPGMASMATVMSFSNSILVTLSPPACQR